MEYSSWSVLVTFAHCNQTTRTIVYRHLRARVKLFLGRFLEKPNCFFRRLDEVEGIIVGAIVRCMMSTDVPAYLHVNPNQLDILVSKNVGALRSDYRTLQSFLVVQEGYTEVFEPPSHIVEMSGLCSVFRKFRKVCFVSLTMSITKKKFQQGDRLIVIYYIRENRSIPTLLTSAMSSQMFALTATHFACYYPRLFANKQCFTVNPTTSGPDTYLPFTDFNFGLDCIDHTANLCEFACPVVWRKTGLKGMGILRWGGMSGNRSTDEAAFENTPFTEWNFMWRRNLPRCLNHSCVNFGRSVDLRERHTNLYEMLNRST